VIQESTYAPMRAFVVITLASVSNAKRPHNQVEVFAEQLPAHRVAKTAISNFGEAFRDYEHTRRLLEKQEPPGYVKAKRSLSSLLLAGPFVHSRHNRDSRLRTKRASPNRVIMDGESSSNPVVETSGSDGQINGTAASSSVDLENMAFEDRVKYLKEKPKPSSTEEVQEYKGVETIFDMGELEPWKSGDWAGYARGAYDIWTSSATEFPKVKDGLILIGVIIAAVIFDSIFLDSFDTVLQNLVDCFFFPQFCPDNPLQLFYDFSEYEDPPVFQ